MIETEAALAKLQRLRYYSDYPQRLFLAALGTAASPHTGFIQVPEPAAWPCPGRRRIRLTSFHGMGRCPHCGRPERPTRLRRPPLTP
jgi:hypothetical protein